MHDQSIVDIRHVILADYNVMKGNKLGTSKSLYGHFFDDIVYSQCEAESFGPVQEAASRSY